MTLHHRSHHCHSPCCVFTSDSGASVKLRPIAALLYYYCIKHLCAIRNENDKLGKRYLRKKLHNHVGFKSLCTQASHFIKRKHSLNLSIAFTFAERSGVDLIFPHLSLTAVFILYFNIIQLLLEAIVFYCFVVFIVMTRCVSLLC